MADILGKRVFILFGFVFILFSALLAFAYSSVISNPGHGGTSVSIVVDGHTMTLQEAISNDYLVDYGPSASGDLTVSLSGNYHSGEVFVSVDGSESSLENAGSFCGSTPSSYSSGISVGHSADDVLVSSGGIEKSFQSAINDGDFCCIVSSWGLATNTECSGVSFTQTSNCGTTRLATGTKTDGVCCIPSCVGKSCGQSDGCTGTCTACGPITTSVGGCSGNQITSTVTTCSSSCVSGTCVSGSCSTKITYGNYCVDKICSGGVCTGFGYTPGGGTPMRP